MDGITWLAQIVVFIKYMVPNGSRKLHPGDSLLVIREDKS